jgi:hypothetical protein
VTWFDGIGAGQALWVAVALSLFGCGVLALWLHGFPKEYASHPVPVPDFAKQLGPRIDELEKAPALVRQVFAGLHAYAAQDVEMGYALLGNGVCEALPDGCLRDHLHASGKHAYIYTEMVALVHRAREQVAFPLSPKKLEWIAAEDKMLYGVLTSAMTPVKALECAGIFAHYEAEKEVGHPIDVPMVEAAKRAFLAAQ